MVLWIDLIMTWGEIIEIILLDMIWPAVKKMGNENLRVVIDARQNDVYMYIGLQIDSEMSY